MQAAGSFFSAGFPAQFQIIRIANFGQTGEQ